MKDLKEALSSGRKPDTTHVRTPFKVYCARACEYGDKTQGGKYERANYLRPVKTMRDAFVRYRSYLGALDRHLSKTLDAMEKHQSTDPNLEVEDGMREAAYAEDTDAKPDCPVGASYLPSACGMSASLNMAIAQAVDAGLLPADPGQPWCEDRQTEFDFKSAESATTTEQTNDEYRASGARYSHDSENCVHRVPLNEFCEHCKV